MINRLLIFFALLIPEFTFAQESESLTQHKITFDFGSFRNRYAYAMNNVQYISPIFTAKHIRVSARLRSYGTWFVFSKIAYDLTPIAEIVFSETTRPLYFSAGIGADIRLRILNDERSEAVSSAEPLLSISANGQLGKFDYQVPLWTRFYSNGISFALLPEARWNFKQKWNAFLRYELSYLSIYGGESHEWRRDCFVGAGFRW